MPHVRVNSAGIVPFVSAAVLAVAASVSGTGCSALRVGADCTAAKVSVATASASDPYGHLVLTANVTTQDGKPVAGAPVNFWVNETGANVPKDFGESIGTQKTDAIGVARLDRQQGFFGLLLPGRTVTGYYAQFIGGTKAGGVTYCGVTTSPTPVKCGGSDACGPIPPLNQVTG